MGITANLDPDLRVLRTFQASPFPSTHRYQVNFQRFPRRGMGKSIIIQPCSRVAGSFLLRSCSPLQVISSLSENWFRSRPQTFLFFIENTSQPPQASLIPFDCFLHIHFDSTFLLFYLPYSEFSLARSCWLPSNHVMD